MYCYFSPYENGGGGGQPPQPSVPMFRVPTVNLSNSMYGGGGGFFNPSVFYGTPVMPRSIAQYPANYPRFSGNGMNLPTPPQLPQLPNFGSPYFQQHQQQFQNPHGFMMHAIEGPPVPSRLTLQGVKNRAQLIELIFFNGIDPIPANEHPSMFNRVLATKQGLIGTEHVIQIMCESNPDYETYLCRNCEYWNSPGNMLEHLQSEDHQLKHMKKKYQRNFREIHVSRKRDRQEKIDKYVKCIAIVETPKVVKRARTVLPMDIMYKIWPTFMDEFDHSWKPVLVKNEPADTQPNFKVEIPDMGYQNPQADNDDNDIITIDSDEDDDNFPATYNQRSIPLPPPPIKKEVIPNVFSNAIKDSCVYALVFIRHEALGKERIEKKKVEEICKLFGVTTDMLFSDEILDYAGKKIGNIGILVAIAANFSNPGVTLSYLFKKFGKNASSLPPQHPSITLLEMGLDKEKTAKLIRDVDMILNPDFKTTPSTAFTRKPTKQPFINNYRFDRPLVPYDGEYIEGDDDEDEYPPTKQRKYYH